MWKWTKRFSEIEFFAKTDEFLLKAARTGNVTDSLPPVIFKDDRDGSVVLSCSLSDVKQLKGGKLRPLRHKSVFSAQKGEYEMEWASFFEEESGEIGVYLKFILKPATLTEIDTVSNE